MPRRELRALITRITKEELEPETDLLGDSDDVEVAVQNALASTLIDRRCHPDDHGSSGVVLVCGTTFIMARARAAVGIVEPRDSDVLIDTAYSTLQGKSNTDAQENFSSSSS